MTKQETAWHLGGAIRSSALLKILEEVVRAWFGPWDSGIDLRESMKPLHITTAKCELVCNGGIHNHLKKQSIAFIRECVVSVSLKLTTGKEK